MKKFYLATVILALVGCGENQKSQEMNGGRNIASLVVLETILEGWRYNYPERARQSPVCGGLPYTTVKICETQTSAWINTGMVAFCKNGVAICRFKGHCQTTAASTRNSCPAGTTPWYGPGTCGYHDDLEQFNDIPLDLGPGIACTDAAAQSACANVPRPRDPACSPTLGDKDMACCPTLF